MSSLSGADLVGLALMLPWGLYMLWLLNRGVRSKDSIGALLTVWPRARPREFSLWIAVSTVVVIGCCLLSYVESTAETLVHRYQVTPGTFISYNGQHGVFRYSFKVQDHQYRGQDSSDQQRVEATEAGAPFDVYYDPLNPNVNSVSEPGRRASMGRATSAFFSALATGVLAIIIRKLGELLRASAAVRATSP